MSIDTMRGPMTAVDYDSRFACSYSGRRNYQQVGKTVDNPSMAVDKCPAMWITERLNRS